MALVYDPKTGRYIDDGARAAAMQAQLSQPVVGPRGVVALRDPNAGLPAPTQTLIPGVPALAQTQLPLDPGTPEQQAMQAAIPQGLGGVIQTAVGGVAAIPALGFDAARRGLTSLAGGDPNTLPGGQNQLSDAAFGMLNQGLDNVTGAAGAIQSGLQSGLRGALGVQPAPVPAAVAAAPVQQPVPAAQPVAPAPVQQPVAVAQPVPVPAAVAPVPTETTPVNVQGLPDRTGFTGGGFGTDAGGNQLSASQYLAQKKVEDQQFVAQRQNAYDALALQQGRSRLEDARGDPVKYRQMLAEQRMLEGQIAGQSAQRNDVAKAQATNAAQLGLAGINNTAAAQRQLAANAAEIEKATQVANLTGQYGLQGAQIKADATNAKTAATLGGPVALLARAQAQSLAERQAAARARFDSTGDLAAYVADLKDGQEPAAQKNPFGVDALTGLPFTQQSAGLAEAIRLQQLQEQLRKSQTK
jgi:hypothetical protein